MTAQAPLCIKSIKNTWNIKIVPYDHMGPKKTPSPFSTRMTVRPITCKPATITYRRGGGVREKRTGSGTNIGPARDPLSPSIASTTSLSAPHITPGCILLVIVCILQGIDLDLFRSSEKRANQLDPQQ